MVTKAQRSKEGHIGDILAVLAGGYREGSGVHTRMWRDLRKLTHDNLFILAQSARKVEAGQKSQGVKICEHENLRCCFCGESKRLHDAPELKLQVPFAHHMVHCDACEGDFLVPCED